jgi:hypothetical protein
MTKAKEVESGDRERDLRPDGAGATAGLILKRKPTNKSGYYGVIPNGKGLRARVYNDSKKRWDTVGTYTTVQEAAIAVAVAEKSRWRRATTTSTPRTSSEQRRKQVQPHTFLVHPASRPPRPSLSHCVCACVTGPVARSRTTGSSHENISVQTPMQGLPDLGEIFSERATGRAREALLQRGRPAMAECVPCACGRRVVCGHLRCLCGRDVEESPGVVVWAWHGLTI